jgi:hypothetical protein
MNEKQSQESQADSTSVVDHSNGQHTDRKRELTEEEAYDKLGYSFSTWRKWQILSVIFAIQVSMNFNAAVYPNVIQGLSDHFNISLQAARVGQMIFLVAYAFGSELWAPWSEELGRWPILQLSLFFVNSRSHSRLVDCSLEADLPPVWQIPCALAPNFGTIVVARFLGGLSSAGGSVTLGMVRQRYHPLLAKSSCLCRLPTCGILTINNSPSPLSFCLQWVDHQLVQSWALL